MIKKLQKKFIFINMLLISIVLITVFTILCFSNYQHSRSESQKAMEVSLSRASDNGLVPPIEIGSKPDHEFLENDESRVTTPIVIAEITEDGITQSTQFNNATMDQDTLETAVAAAQEADSDQGILWDYELRYLISNTSGKTQIAFADMSQEISSLKSVILNSLIGLAGSLTAFFFISLYLAKWALRPVEQAWNRQRQFVADASHELKTPLTVILANTNILLSHRQDSIQQQAKWVENTQAEAGRMKKLVDDLLFLAKSDAEKVPLMMSDLDLSDTVWSCLLPFESVAFEQNITIEDHIEDHIHFTGDQNQLKQLIIILLDNACKYAGNKGIVDVSLKKEPSKICLEINNSGIPIPSEDLEHIFERFYRSDKSRVRKEGGYGLGLAIAQSIVNTHHGKITATSDEWHGTTFCITFPL